MSFLIDEDLPRSIGMVFKKHGHESFDIRDLGMRGAADNEIFFYALKNKFCIISGDYGFADIRNYPPHKHFGIIILAIPKNTSSDYILSMLDNFLAGIKKRTEFSGKLVIVEPTRYRIRS